MGGAQFAPVESFKVMNSPVDPVVASPVKSTATPPEAILTSCRPFMVSSLVILPSPSSSIQGLAITCETLSPMVESPLKSTEGTYSIASRSVSEMVCPAVDTMVATLEPSVASLNL